jgi:hypothetical protein
MIDSVMLISKKAKKSAGGSLSTPCERCSLGKVFLHGVTNLIYHPTFEGE